MARKFDIPALIRKGGRHRYFVGKGVCLTVQGNSAVNGTLNLTRAYRYRHFESDPLHSSPLCPLARTIGGQTFSSFISFVLWGRAMMPARRLSLSL